MLLKRFLILTAMLIFGGLVTANAQSERLSVRLSQEKPSVLGRFSVKFVSVLEDSRCPIRTNCVWAGNAKVKIQVSSKREAKDLEINTNLAPRSIQYRGYNIKIVSLSPKPGENSKAMAAKDTVVFEISRIQH